MKWKCIDCRADFLGPNDHAPEEGCPRCGSKNVIDINVEPVPMLHIDLDDLEDKWGNENKCAVCGFDFDNQNPPEGKDWQVPLQLFRGEGERCQMLCLCDKCAAIRMQKKELN